MPRNCTRKIVLLLAPIAYSQFSLTAYEVSCRARTERCPSSENHAEDTPLYSLLESVGSPAFLSTDTRLTGSAKEN